jgi:hypothetical protein
MPRYGPSAALRAENTALRKLWKTGGAQASGKPRRFRVVFGRRTRSLDESPVDHDHAVRSRRGSTERSLFRRY